jgi:hypothetical protein
MAKEQKTDDSQAAVRMGATGIVILGVSLIAAAFLLGYLLYALWSPSPVVVDGKTTGLNLVLFGSSTTISDEVRLVLLVLVVGLIGSYIHTMISFVNFAGNRKLVKSWFWYYAARPFAGAFLALVFYLVLRGGLLSAGVDTEEINQYGVLAVSGLAGLFSKQAIEKLKETFTTLFRTEKPEKLKDKIE